MRLNEKVDVDDAYDEDKYRKELEDLKEEQEANQKRIDELEAYVNSEHNVRVVDFLCDRALVRFVASAP